MTSITTIPAATPAAPAPKKQYQGPGGLVLAVRDMVLAKRAAAAGQAPPTTAPTPINPPVARYSLPQISAPSAPGFAPGTGGPAPLAPTPINPNPGVLPQIAAPGAIPYTSQSAFAGYFKRGGFLRPGQFGIVGDDGPEEINVLPDGTVQVTPLADDKKKPVISQPAQMPMVQAEQLPLGTSVTLPPIGQPGATPVETLGGLEQVATPPGLPQIGAAPGLTDPRTRLAALDAKDYSIVKDDAGNVTHRGADRDKKWSVWDKIASGLVGWAQGGLAGAIKAGTDRNFFEKMGDENQRARLLPQIAAQQQIAANDAKTANVYADNQYQQERLGEMRSDRLRKVDDRQSRERTSRMTQVAGILKGLPAYNPADPRFQELTQALGDVNLPVTPKDALKKVELKQDQRTGQWTTILTDPATGKQEVRDVVKDGQPFKSTPTVVMQGEYGMLRQNDAQQHQSVENDKNRALRREQFGQALQQKIAADKAKGIFDKVKFAKQVDADFNAGEMDKETYDLLTAIIGQN